MRQWINLMEEVDANSIHDLIAQTKQYFSSQPWWNSRKRADSWKSRHILNMLYYIKTNYDHGKIDADAARRLVAKLYAEKKEVIVGRSIGYKNGRDLRWIDVPGIVDPIEASKKAATSPTAKYLELLGYKEYGITPMISYIDP